MIDLSRRAWRVAMSALAGGGLTAASLGGPLLPFAMAQGTETSTGPTTTGATEGTQTPVTTNPTQTTSTTPTTPTTETGASTTGTSTTSTAPATTPTAGASTTPTNSPATPTPAPTSTATDEAAAPATKTAPEVMVRHKQPTSNSQPANPNLTQTSQTGGAQSANGGASGAPGSAEAGATNAATTGPNGVALPPQLVAGQAAGALAALLDGSSASLQALDFYRIPLFLLPIYQAAAVQYDVPWQILAAINEIETDYGADLSVSSAGAVGWMQFMPQTWLQYGVDALNAGYADPYNPVDAIFAAARYLHAAGASSNLDAAILAYNHSEAYVESVLLRAKLIAAYPGQVIATLTGLIDGRPPVTGRQIAWGAPQAPASVAAASKASLPSASSATAGASAVAPTPTGTPSPTGAAAASTAPQFVDVMSEPNAAVVAVQDGRVVKLGHSRKLGRYVVLQDVYGDVFTYAGLGGIARSYMPPKSQTAATGGAGASTADAAAAKRANATASSAPAGKVRVFAHPQNNPDALVYAARVRADKASVAGPRPLRSGSVVTAGTVLGHVWLPPNAKDGHLRFAIRPAGDTSTIDPRAILENWTQLDEALHPQGAKGNPSLLGATANDVFLMSKSQLERAVLADPGIGLSSCSRHEVAAGAVDKRALAVLAYLSRSGLKPSVGTLRCGGGAFDAAGYVATGHGGDAVAIVAINGTMIAGHQGAGSITDTTIRTLLTLQGEYAPARIVSLMRYPDAPTTLARADHGDYVEVVFPPALASERGPAGSKLGRRGLNAATTAAAVLPAGANGATPTPAVVDNELSAVQWEQLITRVAALPAPTVVFKPSSAAIPDRATSTQPTSTQPSTSSTRAASK